MIEENEAVIAAGEFKAQCLRLMDDVNKTRVPLVITKRGIPVAKLVPFNETAPSLFGYMKDSVELKEDITSTKWS
ncbi:MAG: type II toxin-antitoxin system Phd/YefM family antitoxin [Alphaproteobacteria bacterium]